MTLNPLQSPDRRGNMSEFKNLGLSEDIVKHLETIGFLNPTEIQTKAIPILLGKTSDFVGLAATGTGKTAAFGLPLIEQIDSTKNFPQALILSPTRELAIQIVDQLKSLSSFKKIKIAAIYGGSSYRNQIADIKRGAQIVVATPGRLIDLLEQNIFNLKELQTLILDEADEMISMGFRDSLEEILKRTHPETKETSSSKNIRAACRTWLFSATMSPAIRKISNLYLNEPVQVEVINRGQLSSQITQLYFTVKEEFKLKALTHLLDALEDFYGIIFCDTKMKCAQIEEELNRRGYHVESLHGDKVQKEREWTLRRFKDKQVKVIVATDVAARGLDIPDLTHVVNYSLPWDVESYVHRIGRTGRNGKTGFSYTLASPRELNLLRQVQNKTKAALVKGTIPSTSEVLFVKMKHLAKGLANQAAKLPTTAWEKFIETEEFTSLNSLTKEEIISKFIQSKIHFNPSSEIEFDYLHGRVPRELDPAGAQASSRSHSGGRGRRVDSRPSHLRSDDSAPDDGGGYTRRARGPGGRSSGGPRRGPPRRDSDNYESAGRGRRFDDDGFKKGRSSFKKSGSEQRRPRIFE